MNSGPLCPPNTLAQGGTCPPCPPASVAYGITAEPHAYMQILDTGEAGHTTEYARSPEIKPLNRFANIVVCK